MNLDDTLTDLCEVYKGTKQRRQQALAALPVPAQELLKEVRRVPSTEELAMLSEVPTAELWVRIKQQQNKSVRLMGMGWVASLVYKACQCLEN